ncbi:MAG: PLP-dependent aminotransferase family protein [Myxococcota bacterium]
MDRPGQSAPIAPALFVALTADDPATLQARIRDRIRRLVTEGALPVGARLPSARTLAAQLGVSRTTIDAAIRASIAEGWLVSRPRSGVFVAAGPVPPPPPTAPPDDPGVAPRLSATVSALVPDLHARGRLGAFHLSRPALDAFPVDAWAKILARRAARTTLAQLDYGGESPELRAAIASLVSVGRGWAVDPDQVLLFDGGQSAIGFAARATLDPGDRAWVEDPGYPAARAAIAATGAIPVPVPVDADGLRVDLGVAAAPDARLVYTTPSCQFPLAVPLALDRRRALVRWAASTGAMIVEDDYEVELGHDGPPLPALAALDGGRRVLYVHSFSRTMFPALRIGYLIAPAPLVGRLRDARDALQPPLASLPQLALVEFVAEGHYARHLRRMRVVHRERRTAVLEAVARVDPATLRLRPTSAGLHLLADLAPGIDAGAVRRAASARGVEVMPLAAFQATPGAPDALVLGFGALRPDRAEAAVAALVAAIDEVRIERVTR